MDQRLLRSLSSICDALHDLVPFFEKVKNNHEGMLPWVKLQHSSMGVLYVL